MKINSNSELVFFESFKRGDEKAFAYFYEKYFNAIKSFCTSFIYDHDEAENITQEAFLNLWEKRADVMSLNGIPSFLYTYGKSKCLNAIRHNEVKKRFKNDVLNEKEKSLDLEILSSFSFDTLEVTELEKIIERSIAKLPLTTRTVFLKKRHEHKKNAEIAEEMQVSLKSVEAHMTKALKLLKNSLQDYFLFIFHI
ncbi:RNA polymerase sigma-70 factor [Flavobacterium flavipallidum]|uniref:RNA polymerase sigma-70 factor n=1 Tax=Flavobacterium flavipallidum TaxID=3139140 RepID=A0ABU9HQK3_9FLAO